MLIPSAEVNILNTFRVMIILKLLSLLTNLHLKLLGTQGTGADKLLSTQRVNPSSSFFYPFILSYPSIPSYPSFTSYPSFIFLSPSLPSLSSSFIRFTSTPSLFPSLSHLLLPLSHHCVVFYT